MDSARFDDLARAVGTTSRRGALRLLTGSALGGLLSLLGRWEARACEPAGDGCSADAQCCNGRCRAVPGCIGKHCCNRTGKTCADSCQCCSGRCCGGRCCKAGQICVPIFTGVVCANGTKASGEACDPAEPYACASGECGCFDPAHCTCRAADCGPRGAACASAAGCCQGACGPTPCSGGQEKCCAPTGAPCGDRCDCCLAGSACRGGQCCRREGAGCGSSDQCCGALVCDTALDECAQP